MNKIADTLGRNRLARDITPEDVLGVLRPIYERGKPAMADHVRSYIRSAYSWAIKSEHDYRSTSPRRFKLVINPAAGIPTEPKVVGTRWLDEDEFVRLYRWLEYPDAPVHPPYTRAVRILMLTGQRVEEIARLHVDQWDAKERIIDWSKTKNGRPHAIPVPPLAAELIKSIIPNEYGWFFPSAMDPTRPVSARHALQLHVAPARARGHSLRDQPRPPAHVEDARRQSWSPKEIRDRIQNHALQDVSSKNYDRWTTCPRSGRRWKVEQVRPRPARQAVFDRCLTVRAGANASLGPENMDSFHTGGVTGSIPVAPTTKSLIYTTNAFAPCDKMSTRQLIGRTKREGTGWVSGKYPGSLFA